MGGGSKSPDTSAQNEAARKAEERAATAEAEAKKREQTANEQLSSTARASYGRRTGRRLLIAPGREEDISKLGG